MKALIKILFVVAVLFYAAPLVAVGDTVISTVAVLAVIVCITGLVIPIRYFTNDALYAITSVKVWQSYIIEKLRRTNDWMFKSSDETKNVLKGSVVYIPQAGADPVVEVNDTTYPGTAINREDSDVNYALDIFRTVPHRVPWAELQDISYDKIDSVLASHTDTLAEAVGDSMLIRWAATTAPFQIATTGADVAPTGNQAGNRKGFSHRDLMRAMVLFNTGNVPKKGRVCVIDDNMYEYFYDEMTDKQFNAFNQFANNETGQLGRLHSFDIYSRSEVMNYGAASLTPNAYAAAQLATDNLASICWHSNMIARAIGETKVFYNKDLAIEYGDVMSAILKFGGRKKRADNKGVISIIQGV